MGSCNFDIFLSLPLHCVVWEADFKLFKWIRICKYYLIPQFLSHLWICAERQQFWSPWAIFFFPSSTDSSVGIWVCCFFWSLETWLQNPSFKSYLAEALTCPPPPMIDSNLFFLGWTDFKFVLENRWLTAADSTNWFSCQRSSWFSTILCRLRLVQLCYWFFLN